MAGEEREDLRAAWSCCCVTGRLELLRGNCGGQGEEPVGVELASGGARNQELESRIDFIRL